MYQGVAPKSTISLTLKQSAGRGSLYSFVIHNKGPDRGENTSGVKTSPGLNGKVNKYKQILKVSCQLKPGLCEVLT